MFCGFCWIIENNCLEWGFSTTFAAGVGVLHLLCARGVGIRPFNEISRDGPRRGMVTLGIDRNINLGAKWTPDSDFAPRIILHHKISASSTSGSVRNISIFHIN